MVCARGPPQVLVPAIEDAYGVHHSKFVIIRYPDKLRVFICTANFEAPDWTSKTQGCWCQDFPLKRPGSPVSSPFEDRMIAYMRASAGTLERRRANARPVTIDIAGLRVFDFSGARAALVCSVPGRHPLSAPMRWGHMQARERTKLTPPC